MDEQEQKRGPKPGGENAANGGKAVLAKYGADFYSRIGKKGGQALRDSKDPSYYATIGKNGGDTTNERHGREHYASIGRRGGQQNLGKTHATASATPDEG